GDESNFEPLTKNIAEITGEEEKAKAGSKNAEFDPYKVDKLSRIPAWIKAFFIKFWFAGAVCYFVNMGLGTYVDATLDLMLIDGVLLGIITDCMVNPIFRMIESDRKEYNNFMMFPFPFKKYWTFITNIIYYVGVFITVLFAYEGLNKLAELINKSWYVAVEPMFFGIIVLLVDMAFIGIKDLIVYLVKRNKRKKEEIENV
ncbi:MAG: hypothetical protein K2K04_05170, partial [Clostridia bacterium]|nr:hypothetical protein [Clostridia bacterium]